MSKIIKQTLFCIFILLTLGLFLTCDDPIMNPFTSDMGEKVVVEAPSIYDISPVSNSYLSDIVTFTATAKAYIKVEKVQVYIFESKDSEGNIIQREIPWTDRGIQLSGTVKLKAMSYEFDTRNFNTGPDGKGPPQDGRIRMQFRIFDTTGVDSSGKLIPERARESVELVYTIKNNPSVIKMTYPSSTDIKEPTNITKIQWGGEIRGQVIDLRGIRPGFPQIKIWPEGTDEPPDGWATLFLTGYDDMQKGTATSNAGPGSYADRTQMRVVNAVSFSLHLAAFDIVREPDPLHPADATIPADPDLDLRKVQYRTKDGGNGFLEHIVYDPGLIFNFKIRTRDVEPDPLKGSFPSVNPVSKPPFGIAGFFPPLGFDTPEEDNFKPRVDAVGKDQPIKIIIFSSDSRPNVEINNDDIKNTDPGRLEKKPNIYITDATSKKIETDSGDLFRLRLLLTFDKNNNSFLKGATLSWMHESTNRAGDLAWDDDTRTLPSQINEFIYKGQPNPYGFGQVFTFTALSDMVDEKGKKIFTTSSEPYILLFTVGVNGMEQNPPVYRYVVYIDGESPDVSIRSVRGAAKEPEGPAAPVASVKGGLINKNTYKVNGNIQVVVDRTDNSGIMTFKWGSDMGENPRIDLRAPQPLSPPSDDPNIDYGRPMVKWIIEPATPTDDSPAVPGSTILAMLKSYKDAPNPANLNFFNAIDDAGQSGLTSLPSGWVRRPVSGTGIPADDSNNFKLNTTLLNDKQYYWLYVIAMDQVQNLGFIAQKIYVDQDSDKPEVDIPALFDRNAADPATVGGVPGLEITGPEQLDVTVEVGSPNKSERKLTGNWSSSRPRRNILERDQSIEMNIRDDDGFDISSGISIKLSVLDPVSDLTPPVEKEVTFNAEDIRKALTSDIPDNNKAKDISLKLTQEIMAKMLYGAAYSGGGLKDGMYKIVISVVDDKNAKVAIAPDLTPQPQPGDTPEAAPNPPEPKPYWFAVSTELPVVRVTRPDDNAWGSTEPFIIEGTARSRFIIRKAWITFTPDVINPNAVQDSVSDPFEITLVAAPADPQYPGYYMYTWKYAGKDGNGVVFNPMNGVTAWYNTPVRRFTVEAWDRIGNMGNDTRSVQIDNAPPEVTLSEYNYGRPTVIVDGFEHSELYGKVLFSVSASDANGLYEADGKSGIKWWVLPYTTADPSWNTGYTEYNATALSPNRNPWIGGGNFNLNQSNGGRYTWIIDTRYLDNGQKYKLCIIALDKAGNQSSKTATSNAYQTFTVKQELDFPTIDPNSLDPLQDQVKPKSATISGTVSDIDLFKPANRDNYVKIRFPKTTVTGKPDGMTDANWNDWIPVKISANYSSQAGGIDPSGAIVFKFRYEDYKDNAAVNTYLSTDGVKYYQIQVWDEPVGPTDAEKAGAKWYGKNPDLFMSTDAAKYPGYPYLFHDKVSRVFPRDTKTADNPADVYSFIVDDTYPEIFFDIWDPTPPPTPIPNPNPRPGFSEARPTFSKVELLIAALNSEVNKGVTNGGNYVKEYKLSDLSISYSSKDNTKIFRKLLINNATNPVEAVDGKYKWDLSGLDLAGADKLFKDIFDEADQGMQTIVFEATDMVPLTRRVSYMFWKDTRGPDINFNTISRSIKRAELSPAFPGDVVGPPAVKGWPSDWRYSGTAWTAWSAGWKQIIEFWPSEYAFKATAEVIKQLEAENKKTPSTVIGDPEDKRFDPPNSTTKNPNYSPPVLEGTFSDLYSSVRITVPVGTPTYFYYRFKSYNSKTNTVTDLLSGKEGSTYPDNKPFEVAGSWIRKEIEKNGPDGKPNLNEKEADWRIELNEADGFIGKDGEIWVDMWVKDSADNISDIYNVRFYLDRTAPILGKEPNVSTDPTDPDGLTDPAKITDADEFIVQSIANYKTPPWSPRALAEPKRVFSAAGDSTDAEAFILKGTVSDFNFSGLTIVIGQEGYSGYSVTASVLVDRDAAGAWVYTNPVDKVNNGTTTNDDSTSQKRLTLVTPPTDLADGTPQWEWTLKILQKDVAGLRAAAKNGTTDDADRARRYIRVTASDKANKRVGPVDWFFYLDTKKPILEYTNLEKNKIDNTSPNSFEDSNLALSGTVSDDTRIQDVQYMIGRWDYGAKAWRWWNGTDWTDTAPKARTTWPSAFAATDARQTSMNWVIKQAVLDAAGTTKFPAKLFEQEGRYRLDLYITDFSLGDGNPHYTYNEDDTFHDEFYNPAAAVPGTSNKSGREFLIDKKDPTLRWAEGVEGKTYFRNETDAPNKGQVIFGFIAGDGNTLLSWTAVIKDKDQNIVESDGAKIVTNGSDSNIKWQNEKTSPPDKTAIPVPLTVASNVTDPATVGGAAISIASIYEQYFEIKPYMDIKGDGTGDALDVVLKTLPTYTITITVTDGANRTSSISKTFTLDNTPPRFLQEKFSPLSYKRGTDSAAPTTTDKVTSPGYTPPDSFRTYSYNAVTGRQNIRGNTEDNSNQIKKISYYVVNKAGSDFAAADFPNPYTDNTIEWRSAVDNNSAIPNTETPYIQIDEGTFAWTIMVPRTSDFFDDTKAKKYVQWTTTGGVPITGGASVDAGSYYDVDTSTWVTSTPDVPKLVFPDLNNPYLTATPTVIYGKENVGLITVYVRAEDAAGNVAYDIVKYWIWPEGDRPIITAINNPDSTKIKAERLLNGTIRISGMAKDNERVKFVWFRILDDKGVPYGKGTGTNGHPLSIPKWKYEAPDPTTGKITPIGGTWEEAKTGNQDDVAGSTIGAIRTSDSLKAWKPTDTTTPTGSEDGWYMANGGNSREVSWFAYINTGGELDPTGTEESKQFTVEVRAQDVTYDDKNDLWRPYSDTYKGMASAMTNLSKVDAWVVAGAPIFEDVKVASVDSKTADAAEITPPKLWDTIDNLNIRNRSAYKVTVKHNSGLSSIRWSPTFWDRTLNGNAGAFQANPKLDTFNLLDLSDTTSTNPDCVYVYRTGAEAYATDATKKRDAVFTLMNAAYNPNNHDASNATPRMALTVKPRNMMSGNVDLKTTKNYMVWKWDIALESSGVFPYLVGTNHDTTHFDKNGNHKDMKNSVFTPTSAYTGSIGSAILIESELEGTVNYFKWDVIVDVRADLLLADMKKDDTAYGNGSTARAGQVENSVRYPVYLSASEVSKATPLTSRGDTLLPIDNLKPSGQYTLNRKPAGSAATIGGTAEDLGPVNGLARVVLWFQKKGTFISWHEQGTGKRDGTSPADLSVVSTAMENYTDGSGGPAWWDAILQPGVSAANGGVIPAGVTKPKIPNKPPLKPGETVPPGYGMGGDWAIVIDTNSPSVGKPAWGHTLPMGFADGGRYWYVEINSLGIESGPVDMHFVVMDKAGNAKYYKERLVIMNGVAVIDRVKLGTDIRHNTSLFAGNDKGDTGTALAASPILNKIRAAVPLGGDSDPKNDVKKGISEWVQSSAMGVSNIVDFNVRNNVFALRVETTDAPSSGKVRHFRLEYISGATLLTNAAENSTTLATSMKAGRVYMVNDPGTVKWGALGADGDSWKTGDVFIAVINGQEPDPEDTTKLVAKISGRGSVWELNSKYYETGAKKVPPDLALADVDYSIAPNPNAKGAEFVYGNSAFGTAPADTGSKIVDHANDTDAWPPAMGANPVSGAGNSMFILRVFDGPEDDYFGDFTILRVRVNNNDRTPPFAQLYDINPKTETQKSSLTPLFIGEGTGSNRTKGGLWNMGAAGKAISKPGHIEPRAISGTTAPYNNQITIGAATVRQQHSLNSAQMGGAATPTAATIQNPFADPRGFFTADTVSGQVVLRGYAEDDQRIQRVDLVFNNSAQTVNILLFQEHAASGAGAGTPGDPANYSPPLTGLLKVGTGPNAAGNVYFTDSIDAYRHRVEWAYIWDTEAIPSTTNVVGDVTVRVRSYNRSALTANGKTDNDNGGAPFTAADPKTHSNTPAANKPNTSPFNPGLPNGLYEYSQITMGLRPYITGFKRNQAQFSHDTRSRQGRYMFYRGETAVVTGFNLGAGTISLPGAANLATSNVPWPVTDTANYGITETNETARNRRYRQFTVGTGAVTGNGLVTYTNSQGAVNTGGGRPVTTGTTTSRPDYIQPWNIEYSPAVDGSQLWDDFTQVHIWQSNDLAPGAGNNNATTASGRFASRDNSSIFNPAMSLDPKTGLLYESHNESSSGPTSTDDNWYNTGRTRKSGIVDASISPPNANNLVTQFADPIFFSDVYRSPGGPNQTADTWAVSSIIGRSSTNNYWRALGGIYINGPNGGPIAFHGGGRNTSQGSPSSQDSTYSSSLYYGESTWYNASSDSGRTATPPTTDQFMNPHIVTSYANNQEHIHVSYYDDKDGSIKYRYNLRGTTGTIDGGNQPNVANNNAIPRMWVNLDGGYDEEDRDSTTTTSGAAIAANARLKNPSRTGIKAGKHNSIATTSQGYPVIAYQAQDATSSRLKLAVSNSATPYLADNWTIHDNISGAGTGEFVSMKIDTKDGLNRVHIAAMNTNKRLVYITFLLSSIPATPAEQIVDSVGNVGRWCALSLDEQGNPWISYMDESWIGARDGVKVAYKNTAAFYKGGTYRPTEDIDINGKDINGWEAMHVPTRHRVENPTEGPGREHGRLGMECFPARNNTPNSGVTRFWSGAVSYLSQDAEMNDAYTQQLVAPMDRYRIAYYVK